MFTLPFRREQQPDRVARLSQLHQREHPFHCRPSGQAGQPVRQLVCRVGQSVRC